MSEGTTEPRPSESDEQDVVDGGPHVSAEVTAAPPVTVSITVDGRQVSAKKGELVIAAAERAGTYIPRFCWHERMSSVGMCRMCLVEIDTGRGPQLTPSCMVTVAPDMKVDTRSPATKRAQEGVLELLLVNHPLDCPVCDKGGECPLQDQAFSHGPGESRFVEEKRHFAKPIPISQLVYLDRERCILCDRCTRFADEVAGDPLIHFTQRGNDTQVMTFPDEPFASYFSGNTVQICPVGALTATPYRFKARPWDLDEVESTCTTCSVGCRMTVQSTRDTVVRYLGVDIDAVNWGWLCDKGRFGFEQLVSDDRLAEPMVRGGGGLEPASWSTALGEAARLLTDAIAAGGPGSVAVLGGARGSNEDAYAWARLADTLGIVNRDAQFGDGLPAAVLGLDRATINEAAGAATVVVLGPDLKEELPVLYLRLRHAAERKTTRIVELTPTETGLSRYAWRSVRIGAGGAGAAAVALAESDVVEQLASGPIVVIAGRANLAESESSAVATLNAVLAACPAAKVLPALRRGNVLGALQAGLRPVEGGLDGLGVLEAAADGRLECLVLLGADPISDCPDSDLANRAVTAARRVIAIDVFPTASTQLADVVLAAAAFAEKSGTTTNLEGRIGPLAKRVTVRGSARPDWMIAAELAMILDHDELADELASVEVITAALAANVEGYNRVTAAANGDPTVVAAGPRAPMPAVAVDVAGRNNYDFRLAVSRTLYDLGAGVSHSPSLAGLGAESAAHLNPVDVGRLGVVAGTEVRVVGTRGSLVMTLVADPAVPKGTLWAPFRAMGPNVGVLIDARSAANDVRVERLDT